MSVVKFKVDDTVEVLKPIWNHYFKLSPGDKAKIANVFQVNVESPQIVELDDLKGRGRMVDIVIFDNSLLRMSHD